MRNQADFVQESPQTEPQPYGEVALGVECAWPDNIPLLGLGEALTEATSSIRFQL